MGPGNKLPRKLNELLIQEEEGFQHFLIRIDLKDEDRRRLGITAVMKKGKVVVVKVGPGTPAERHFRESDHITTVNGISVTMVEQVKNLFVVSKKMCLFVVERISPQKLQMEERLEKVEMTKEKLLEKVWEVKSKESSAGEGEEIEDKKDEAAGVETEQKKETTDDQFEDTNKLTEEEHEELYEMVEDALEENVEQGKMPEHVAEGKETAETKEDEKDADSGEESSEEEEERVTFKEKSRGHVKLEEKPTKNRVADTGKGGDDETGGKLVKEKVQGFGREENESRCGQEGRFICGRGRGRQFERPSGSEKTFSGVKATEECDSFGQGNWGTQDGMEVQSDEVADVKWKNERPN